MKPKVLLVTNDPTMRLRLAGVLEGTEVHIARDEQETRQLLDRFRREEATDLDSLLLTRQGEILPFEDYERRILSHALATTGWNVKQAASRLGIGRATLYRKIDRYDLRRRDAG